jgi:hypothetical protein
VNEERSERALVDMSYWRQEKPSRTEIFT